MICPQGKRQFKTQVEAVTFNKAFGKKEGYCNVYRCKWCGDYHLASRAKKVIRIKLR